jgi:hypothetical protein
MYLLVFTHLLMKCTVQEAKSPAKKSRQAALRGGIKFRRERVKTGDALHYDAQW